MKRHEQLRNMDKKPDAWKKNENEIKYKRSSKKKRTLLHFFLVFLLVVQAGHFRLSGAFFALG